MSEEEKLIEFLDDLKSDARSELKDIQNCNCYAAGYEVGKIDVINEIKAFIGGKDYDFGKEY